MTTRSSVHVSRLHPSKVANHSTEAPSASGTTESRIVGRATSSAATSQSVRVRQKRTRAYMAWCSAQYSTMQLRNQQCACVTWIAVSGTHACSSSSDVTVCTGVPSVGGAWRSTARWPMRASSPHK